MWKQSLWGASFDTALTRLLRMRSETLMVRSAAAPRVSNDEAAMRPRGENAPSHLPRIRKRKRAHPPRVLVQNQRPRDRRLGALRAVFAFAEPAIDADRRSLGFLQVHPGGVNKFSRMADFAPQTDRKARLRLRVRRHRSAHHLRDREIARAVGQFD